MTKPRRQVLSLHTLDRRDVPSAVTTFDPLTRTVTITGDAENNVAVVGVQAGSVVVDVDGATASFPASQVRNLVFVGHAGDDQFTNNTAIRSLGNGGDGNDVLTGGSGRDDFFGGAGDDSMVGNAGDDRIYGGAGNDALWGNDGKDELRGDTGDDTLLGGAGDDELRGGAGTDRLDGGAGRDRIRYTAGIDVIMNPDATDRLSKDDDIFVVTVNPTTHT